MKIGYFITARLKSTRLKRKILLPIENKAIIEHVIERCKAVKGISGVVLCTSTNSQDAELYKFALKQKIEFYPGSEDDVLERLEDAAKYYGYDAFVSITADNPLHSILVAENLISLYNEQDCDFIFTKGLPTGIMPYFIKTKALQVANFMKKATDTEIWGPFVNRSDFFRIGELHVKNSPYKEETRLTCDVADDYALLKSLYSKLNKGKLVDIIDIISVLKKNPAMLNLNKNIVQRGVSKDLLDTINNQFNKMIPKGNEFARSLKFHQNPELLIRDINL